ncbi:MAG TPA: hypothetical protein VM221_10620 [Armatimonadota bacterium]|nr:hypothetical protein [Armatimonadota bacterium]
MKRRPRRPKDAPPIVEPAAASPRHQRRVYLGVSGFVLIAFILHAAIYGAPVFTVDDAYITLHNAQVLHSGRDPNFASTPALAGATSAIHLALVYGLMFALPAAWAGAGALWLAILAYALGLARLAFLHRAPALGAVLLVALGLMVARVTYQLLNGMETGLAMAGLVWALALFNDPMRRRWVPVACGVLPFLRPELVVVSGLLLVLHARREWRAAPATADPVRPVVIAILLAVAAAAPWVLWYWVTTGAPYASTIGAKRAFFAEAYAPTDLKLYEAVLPALVHFGHYLGFLLLGVPLLFLTPTGAVGLAFIGAVIAAYLMDFPGAFLHCEQRYLYVLLPVFLYAIASGFAQRAKWVRTAALAILVLALVQSAIWLPQRWREHRAGVAFTTEELEGVAAWCRQNLSPDTLLLVHDVGYISYATSFRMVDFVGLKTPSSIPYHLSYSLPTRGRDRALAVHAIALRSGPAYLVMLQKWDDIFYLTDGLRVLGWTVDRVSPARAYVVYRLTPPPQAAASAIEAGAGRR